MKRQLGAIGLGVFSLCGLSLVGCGASDEAGAPNPSTGVVPTQPSSTPTPPVSVPATNPPTSGGGEATTAPSPTVSPSTPVETQTPSATPPVVTSEPPVATPPTVPVDPAIGNPSFILGADVSWTLQDEDGGAQYFDQGVQMDLLQILQNHGFNYVRLRTFVNPENVYALGDPEAWDDLDHTIEMGQRVKQQNMGFLLDFHYSDNWADPGKQVKPFAWANLSFEDLVTTVHDYTRDAIVALIAGGARPDMVQIGNEITPGMLWPEGETANGNWPRLGMLLKAGVAAVREVDPAIRIVMHIDRGGDLNTTNTWIYNAIQQGVEFDILAESTYTQFQGPPDSWQATFEALVANPDFAAYGLMSAEYSPNKREANDIVFNLPDNRGLGTFIWEPTRFSEAIFDRTGDVFETNDFINVFDEIAADYGLATP